MSEENKLTQENDRLRKEIQKADLFTNMIRDLVSETFGITVFNKDQTIYGTLARGLAKLQAESQSRAETESGEVENEKEIYNNAVVGYRITEIEIDETKHLRFYYTQDKTQKVQFEIWIRDYAEMQDALLKSVKDYYNDDRFLPSSYQQLQKQLSDAKAEIERLKGEWIPVSEQLPEVGEIVEVTVADSRYRRTHLCYLSAELDGSWFYDTGDLKVGNLMKERKVVAWRELPESYKQTLAESGEGGK